MLISIAKIKFIKFVVETVVAVEVFIGVSEKVHHIQKIKFVASDSNYKKSQNA